MKLAADNKFYVYIYIDPLDGKPFYVGKGCGLRMYVHLSEVDSTLKSRKIQKIKNLGLYPVIRVPFYRLAELVAFELEKDLISVIGRIKKGDGPLTNMDEGGLGSGIEFTDEIKAKISKNHHDISGTNNPNYGNHKPLSKEHKRKLSESLKGRRKTKEHKDKIRAANAGRPFSLEHRQKLREAWARRKALDNMCN
jgi:hypothetical protein